MKPAEYFQQHIPKLRSFIRKRIKNADLTDDILQETLLRTYRGADLSKTNNPLAYMVTVSKNVLFDHWKSQNKFEFEDSVDTLEDQNIAIEDKYMQTEKLHILSDLLQEMPPLRQKVFKMRRLDGKSREEIASELGISVEAVKKHINRAMVEITVCAEKHGWKF